MDEQRKPCFTGVWESLSATNLDAFLAAKGMPFLKRLVAVPLLSSVTQRITHVGDHLTQSSCGSVGAFTQLQRLGTSTTNVDMSGATVSLTAAWDGAVWVVHSRPVLPGSPPTTVRRWLDTADKDVMWFEAEIKSQPGAPPVRSLRRFMRVDASAPSPPPTYSAGRREGGGELCISEKMGEGGEEEASFATERRAVHSPALPASLRSPSPHQWGAVFADAAAPTRAPFSREDTAFNLRPLTPSVAAPRLADSLAPTLCAAALSSPRQTAALSSLLQTAAEQQGGTPRASTARARLLRAAASSQALDRAAVNASAAGNGGDGGVGSKAPQRGGVLAAASAGEGGAAAAWWWGDARDEVGTARSVAVHTSYGTTRGSPGAYFQFFKGSLRAQRLQDAVLLAARALSRMRQHSWAADVAAIVLYALL